MDDPKPRRFGFMAGQIEVPDDFDRMGRDEIERRGDERPGRLFHSAASLWEIAIKSGLGRSDFSVDAHVLRRGLVENGSREWSISGAHAVAKTTWCEGVRASPAASSEHPGPCRVHEGTRRIEMTHEIYEVVEHDGGWAYTAKGVFSETFPTRDAAQAAAKRVAREQRVPGEGAEIQYEDSKGEWHTEHSPGNDRPSTTVKD